MRAGGIIGLKKQNVNLKKLVIKVLQGKEGPTKSRKVRSIPMNLEEILDDHNPTITEESNASEYVFPDEYGNMREEESGRVSFKSPLKSALRKDNLPRIKFHDLRHTFASNFVMKDAIYSVTLNTLCHVDPPSPEKSGSRELGDTRGTRHLNFSA